MGNKRCRSGLNNDRVLLILVPTHAELNNDRMELILVPNDVELNNDRVELMLVPNDVELNNDRMLLILVPNHAEFPLVFTHILVRKSWPFKEAVFFPHFQPSKIGLPSVTTQYTVRVSVYGCFYTTNFKL